MGVDQGALNRDLILLCHEVSKFPILLIPIAMSKTECCVAAKQPRALNGEGQSVILFYGRPAYDCRQDLEKSTCFWPHIRWTLTFRHIFAQE